MRLTKKVTVYIMFLLAIGFMTEIGNDNMALAKTGGHKFPVPESFSNLSEMSSPAVVNIRTERTVKSSGGRMFQPFGQRPFGKNDQFRDFFEKFYGKTPKREFKRKSLGSGFIIDKEGYIITNNHVVENTDKITVVLNDEKEFDAEIIGCDSYTDLALIKIKPHQNLTSLKMGDSDKLKVGEWVVAIGNPFGLSHTVTAGIVSAKGRVIGSGPYDDYIQTDASINPGNSGGPLLNIKGEVIGINTMIIAGGQGIGFAIPINLAKGVIKQLKTSGGVTRGWLGVTIQDLKGEIAEYYSLKDKKGVLVIDVVPGDPAAEAGIKPEDIIIKINGKKIEDSRELTSMIADVGVGETARVKVLRAGKQKTFNVKVGKRPDSAELAGIPQKEKGSELGISVKNITPQIARHFKISEDEGVIVVNVDSESKGAEAGIQQGDIIAGINRRDIKNIKDYNIVIKNVNKGELVSFLIKRRTGLIVINITK